MKFFLRYFSALQCVFLLLPSFFWGKAQTFRVGSEWIHSSSDSSSLVIVLDAGHGGEDGGAVGKDGTAEKELNLSIVLHLAEMLRGVGYTVALTREDDRLLYRPEENIKGMRKICDLKNRVLFCRNYEKPVFLSIHMNAFPEEKYKGLQTYYSENNSDSEALARRLQLAVTEKWQSWNLRQIKGGKGIYLLEQLSCPAVLVECGFLSNSEECSALRKEDYQKELCFLLFCAMIEYVSVE